MKKTLVIGIAVVGLALTGCGSDDDATSDSADANTTAATTEATTEATADVPTDTEGSASPDLDDPQAAAAAATLAAAELNGVTLDEDCVGDLAAQLSDDDATKIATENTSPLSAEGEALGEGLLGCADQDELIDVFIRGLTESGVDVDEDCAREKLQDVDIAALVTASQNGNPPADVVESLSECFAP